jgi:hypothetical protein
LNIIFSITILRINTSNNQNYRYTGFILYHASISTTKYSTFENNIANGHSCLWWHPSVSSIIEYSNIINNSQLSSISSHNGILGCDGKNINVKHCSFINNNQNKISKLFHRYSGSYVFFIYDCYFDSISFSTPGHCSIVNTITSAFTNILFFFETEKCPTEFLHQIGFISKVKYQSLSLCKTCFSLSILIMIIL